MPTAADILAELEALGTEQNRKIYARHGAAPPMFGVSYAHLGALTKKLKTDQPLAEALWKSGNHDARILATMIADPARCTAALLRRWAASAGSHVVADALAGVAAASPAGRDLADVWRADDDEMLAACGWTTFARLVGRDDPPYSERELHDTIAAIERTIHAAKNRVRYAMNGALISLGVRGGDFADAATEAARRIGVVQVDHGETGCKTPDAAAYIAKTLAHRAKKAAPKPRPARAAAARPSAAPRNPKASPPRRRAS